MIEILKLFYKKCLSSRTKREYYNISLSSWKFLLLITFFFMLIFYLIFDPTSKIIQFLQAIVSGIFISVLAYVGAVILPERNQIDCIISIFENDLKDGIRIMFEECKYEKGINEHHEKYLIRFYYAHIFQLLKILETHFGKIDRSIGIKRCLSETNGLFSIFESLKIDFENLIKYLEDPEKNKDDIDKCIKNIELNYKSISKKDEMKSIKKVKTRVSSACNSLKNYYFLK